jgi:hypothetical protein
LKTSGLGKTDSGQAAPFLQDQATVTLARQRLIHRPENFLIFWE